MLFETAQKALKSSDFCIFGIYFLGNGVKTNPVGYRAHSAKNSYIIPLVGGMGARRRPYFVY